MIDRRTFIGTLASGLLASPYTTYAQQPTKIYRIGVLGGSDSPPWQALLKGLRELGYVEGRNIAMEWRWSEGNADRYTALAEDLVQAKVDIIVAGGTQAVRSAKNATRAIPIVMTVGAYPDKVGLVESLARPGGNITGLTNIGPDLMGKSFQVLKEMAPKISRVAVLRNPANPVEVLAFKEILAAAPGAGVEIQPIEVRTQEDYAAGLPSVIASRADALFAFGNPVNFKNRQLIADFALKSRLPSVFQERVFVVSGGLVSYAPSYIDLFERAATYVDKILKGAKPGELPIEQPTKIELVLNLKTAKTLGLTLPQSILLRADEVIQ